MKRIFTFFVSIFLGWTIYCQSPEKISYQAVVRDANNNLIIHASLGLQISILQGSIDNPPVYTETQIATSNANGLVSLEIGNGTVLSGGFNKIDWVNGPFFIKIEIDLLGGTSYTIISTSQLLSVPYALHAKTAESISGNISEIDPVFGASVANGITQTDTINWNNKLNIEIDGSVTNEIQTISRTGLQVALSDGGSFQDSVNIFTGDMQNQNIVNLANPVNDNDAATKAYVESLIEELYRQGALRVRDYDGNYYNTIKIGNQIWMSENLKSTFFANGDAITDGTGIGDISGESEPKYWFAYNDDLNNVSTYGRLYTWYTIADTRNVCPDGWHIPNDSEWRMLTDYLGGEMIAGGKFHFSAVIPPTSA